MIDYELPIISMGMLPTQEEMANYEKIFWSKKQLDRNGNRTNISRTMPPEDRTNLHWLRYSKK